MLLATLSMCLSLVGNVGLSMKPHRIQKFLVLLPTRQVSPCPFYLLILLTLVPVLTRSWNPLPSVLNVLLFRERAHMKMVLQVVPIAGTPPYSSTAQRFLSRGRGKDPLISVDRSTTVDTLLKAKKNPVAPRRAVTENKTRHYEDDTINKGEDNTKCHVVSRLTSVPITSSVGRKEKIVMLFDTVVTFHIVDAVRAGHIGEVIPPEDSSNVSSKDSSSASLALSPCRNL